MTDDFVSLIERPAWQALAACRGHDTAKFFPERGESTTEAKALCRRCLTQGECLFFALEHGEVGVWGGLSRRERIRLVPPAA